MIEVLLPARPNLKAVRSDELNMGEASTEKELNLSKMLPSLESESRKSPKYSLRDWRSFRR